MENLSGISGCVASTSVLFTLVAKDMRLLRIAAIFSNLAFIIYGTIEWLPPVLFLHLVLLPLNIMRLLEVVRTDDIAGNPIPLAANRFPAAAPLNNVQNQTAAVSAPC